MECGVKITINKSLRYGGAGSKWAQLYYPDTHYKSYRTFFSLVICLTTSSTRSGN